MHLKHRYRLVNDLNCSLWDMSVRIDIILPFSLVNALQWPYFIKLILNFMRTKPAS
ncbi:hypothetical protein BDV34DRAFT_195055 [Aspergillus parasiticus]|uniref:Uncharacterized protein n=1 Tax=Aspergillus parasiticus TaxID=5067 RepID=A0A5N6DKQ5_ASPPA|nr:hypothetical protein BDV34DRAFT_195055 [Aspergillus parasiticus]